MYVIRVTTGIKKKTRGINSKLSPQGEAQRCAVKIHYRNEAMMIDNQEAK